MPTPRPILIVDDDAALRSTLAEQIAEDGDFTADEAGSAGQADALLSNGEARYDAILLDIGLPDGDGREFCAKLRRDGRKMPVIMLTGADAEEDVVLAWRPAPTTISPSRSGCTSCSPGSVPSCGCSIPPRTRSSRLDPISSDPA